MSTPTAHSEDDDTIPGPTGDFPFENGFDQLGGDEDIPDSAFWELEDGVYVPSDVDLNLGYISAASEGTARSDTGLSEHSPTPSEDDSVVPNAAFDEGGRRQAQADGRGSMEPVLGGGSTTSTSTSTSSSGACDNPNAVPTARKRGRPKGSKNKSATSSVQAPGAHTTSASGPPTGTAKRPRGRPPGTGAKQKARREAEEAGAAQEEISTRPRGRPPKLAPVVALGTSSMRVEEVNGRFRVAGIPRRVVGTADADMGSTTPLFLPPSLNLVPDSRSAPSRPSPRHLPPHVSPSTPSVPSAHSESTRAFEVIDGDAFSEDEGEGYTGLMQDGLGVEDDVVDGPDDSELDRPGDVLDNLPRRVSRSSHPEWLLRAFSARVAEAGDGTRNEQLPPAYRDGSFWFPVKSTFFLLQREGLRPETLFNPRFFNWDPAKLMKEGIRCPHCKTKLWQNGYVPYPRRVIDFSESFWIIGYQYRCPTCVNPKSGKVGTTTFRSWDRRIIAQLPPHLRAEFPARLTRQSGISNTVFGMMRSCFQNGMGSKQFADSLRVQHMRHYDELHLQYLNYIQYNRGSHSTATFPAFPAFDDHSSNGYHGYVPSSQWLRDLYDEFISEHEQEINQHTAMLSGEVCAIDHSHKITKHIFKLNGVELYIGLLTVTNEKGEIRVCNLVSTKSHSQFELALVRMRRSLDTYGHIQPQLFYTDNISDRQFLEDSFPSLREGVVPVEKYAHLEELTIPSNIQVYVKSSVTAIDTAILDLIQQVPEDGVITVGLDMEWNVDLLQTGHNRSATAIMQIAYGDVIYILQIGRMLTGGSPSLPPQLQSFLANPRVKKVGRLLEVELKHLEVECHSPKPFIGSLDLARLAKERHVIRDARASLADLCAMVLQRRINKSVPARISTAWENLELTDEQLKYAALDAYASLRIFEALEKISVPGPLPDIPVPGIRVLLYHMDNTRVVAHGEISSHILSKQYDNINITPTRTVIKVTKVIVPGAIISTHHKRSLESFGEVPFHVVCLCSHVRVSNMQESVNMDHIDVLSHTSMTQSTGASTGTTSSYGTDPALDDLELSGSNIRAGSVIFDYSSNLQVSEEELESRLGEAESDETSAALGRDVLKGMANPHIVFPLRRRVLKDVWHVFNMLYISKTHSLLLAFSRALRDALFLPDHDDKMRISRYGSTLDPPRTWEDMVRYHPKWVWARCKRVIPPPEQLYRVVLQVFQTYGPLKDAQTGQPLFNAAAWRAAKNILSLIQDGYVSDPPGIPLYYIIGLDRKAGHLPIYRCIRGTNFTEGGVHKHLRSRLPTSGVSPRHMLCSLLDFILRHNLLVGTYNSTGKRYVGHYDLWLTNQLQEMLITTADIVPAAQHTTIERANGNLYQQTDEVFGILPVPEDVRHLSGMLSFDPLVKSEHHFLASKQQTRKAVLPIHTMLEIKLFRQLMHGDPAFNQPSGEPLWRDAVKVWNRHAEASDGISYKLIEHLKAYYNTWKTNLNIKHTLMETAEARERLERTIRDPVRQVRAPRAQERPRQVQLPTAGLLPLVGEHYGMGEEQSDVPVSNVAPPPGIAYESMPSPSNPATTHRLSNRSGSEPSTLAPTASASSVSSEARLSGCTPAAATSLDQVRRLAAKRGAEANIDIPPTKKKKASKTCAKCGSDKCAGRGRGSCLGVCRDCKHAECRGRNSKKPGKVCAVAWEDEPGVVCSRCSANVAGPSG